MSEQYVHQQQKVGRFTVKVLTDDFPESPRDWSNLGVMVCPHKRHNLGDKHDIKGENFNGWDAIEEHLRKEEDALVVLPIYMHNHSSITISTSPFSCRWDSGQVGLIYATKEAIIKDWPSLTLEDAIQKATQCLEGEVETYDKFLTGQVYAFIVEDEQGKHIDSCYGYYSEKEALDAGVDTAQWHVNDERKEHQAKLKAQIKHKTPLERRAVLCKK